MLTRAEGQISMSTKEQQMAEKVYWRNLKCNWQDWHFLSKRKKSINDCFSATILWSELRVFKHLIIVWSRLSVTVGRLN